MFCSNCGTQIPESSKFCPGCGTQTQQPQQSYQQPQQTYAQPQQSYQQPQQTYAQPQQTYQQYGQAQQYAQGYTQPKPQKNKAVPILIGVAAALVAFIIGFGVIAPALSGGNSGNSSAGNSGSSNAGTVNKAPSAAYEEIFLSRNIVQMPSLMMTSGQAAFATVDADGNVENLELGYDGDTVKEYVCTVYVPVEGMSEADLAVMDSVMQETFAEYDALNCCSVRYHTGNLYYSVTITITGLDKKENIAEAAPILEIDKNTDYISMEETEKELLAGGYIKR